MYVTCLSVIGIGDSLSAVLMLIALRISVCEFRLVYCNLVLSFVLVFAIFIYFRPVC